MARRRALRYHPTTQMENESESWYFARRDQQQQHGPVPLATLRRMVAAGQLGAEDLVWTAAMPQWAPAGSVPALAPAFAPVAAHQLYPQGQQQQQQRQQPGDAGGSPQMLGYGLAASHYRHDLLRHVEYGGFWIRVVAYIVDSIIIGVPLFLLFALFDVLAGIDPLEERPGSELGMLLEAADNITNFIVSWLYFALLESSERQATFGKSIFGLIVTDTRGQQISFARATGRYFAKILSALILFIGFIMVAFTRRKQGLHDQLADTVVVKKSSLPRYADGSAA